MALSNFFYTGGARDNNRKHAASESDGKDESLGPEEPHESITDPVVWFDAQWVYFAKFHNMDTGPSASMTMLQSR